MNIRKAIHQFFLYVANLFYEEEKEVSVMGELTKKLRYQKTNGVTGAITLYSTAAEAGDNHLNLQVDNVNAYAALGEVSDANASHLRIQKGNTTYAVLSQKAPDVVINNNLIGIHDLVAVDKEWFDPYEEEYFTKRVYASPDGKFILDPNGGLYIPADLASGAQCLVDGDHYEQAGYLWMSILSNGATVYSDGYEMRPIEGDGSDGANPDLYESHWYVATPALPSNILSNNTIRINVTSYSVDP